MFSEQGRAEVGTGREKAPPSKLHCPGELGDVACVLEQVSSLSWGGGISLAFLNEFL